MRKFLLLIALAIAFAPTFSATLSYTSSLPLATTNWVKPVSVPQFDPSLGILLQADFSLKAHVEGLAFFENMDSEPATILSNLSAELLLADGTLVTTAMPVIAKSDDVAAFDGIIDFGGTSGKTYSNVSADQEQSNTWTDPTLLNQFIGNGYKTLYVTAEGKSYVTGAGNLAAGFQTKASAIIEVKYLYNAYGSIGDRVWLDKNADGVQDPDEIGINNVNVVLKDNDGNVIKTTVTSGDGDYLFTELIQGDYTIEIVVSPDLIESYELDGTLNSSTTVSLGDGENRRDVDFGYYNLGCIGDVVWLDSDEDGAYEPVLGEVGIDDVLVTLFDINGNIIKSVKTAYNSITGDHGYYQFCDLKPGCYIIKVYKYSSALKYMKQTFDYDLVLDYQTSYCLSSGEVFTEADFGFVPQCIEGPFTPGYWKNHPTKWPLDEIVIGNKTYTKAEALKLLGKAEGGDKSLTMFRALLSAKLNVALGNPTFCIESVLIEADAWMAMYGPAGSCVKASSQAWRLGEPLATTLDNYNNGLLCAKKDDCGDNDKGGCDKDNDRDRDNKKGGCK